MPNHAAALRRTLCAAAAGALALSGCTSSGQPAETTDGESSAAGEPLVLATFTILADMAAEVGGEHIEVRSITPQGAEVHEYNPTPSDIRSAAEADLVIENGLGLETWLDQFLQHADAPTVTLTDGIDTLPVTRLPGHPDDLGSDAQMPDNPHAWMSPVQAQTYVDTIEQALSSEFPEHSESFADNAEQYRGQIEQLHQQTAERFAAVDEHVHLVTCEGAFSYLAEEYGLGEHYLWPMNSQNEGTAAQAQSQIDYVEEHQVPAVFCESTVNDSSQQQVASATDAELGDPLHVDSLTAADGPVPTYLELLSYDVDQILGAYE